jgi:OFA family oxalate/formate antiporter-like MFS transporter
VPLGNVLSQATGDWHAVFVIAALMNAVAAIMALAVLRPLRSSEHARNLRAAA